MIIRIYNNDSSDYVDYEADTIEEIRDMCKDRINMQSWCNCHSEIIRECAK